MKQRVFLQKKNLRLLLPALVIFAVSSLQVKAQDPFMRLKTAAMAGQTQTLQLSKVTLTSSNPVWKPVSLKPVTYVPFPMQDAFGKTLKPTDKVTLKNGKVITALEYFTQLNDVEKKLNLQGYSVRTGPSVTTVSKVLTPLTDLAGRVSLLSTSIGPLRSEEALKSYMNTEKKVGTLILKPIDKYTAEELETVSNTNFAVSNNVISQIGNAVTTSVTQAPPAPTVLKGLNEFTTKDWYVGNPATFKAGIKGTLTRKAQFYNYPNSKQLNEYRVTVNGTVYGTIFNNTLNLLTGDAEFYAPSDPTKPLSATLTIRIVNAVVLNLNETYPQYKNLAQTKAAPVDQFFPIEVPIVAGVNFSGKIGVRGSVGIESSADIYRSYLMTRVKPVADIMAYVEAGANVLGVLELGVGGNLTFLKSNIDMEASVGLYSANARQVVAFYNYYMGYDLNMLSGNLFGYADVNYFLDTKRFTHEFFNWTGFRQSGTTAEAFNTYTFPEQN